MPGSLVTRVVASGRRTISVTVGRVIAFSIAVDAPERVIFRNPFEGVFMRSADGGRLPGADRDGGAADEHGQQQRGPATDGGLAPLEENR
jgi:hypothetical protein